jgi:bifunctional enzyme CysN/CysC
VARVVTADGDRARAESGRSVTLTFADEIDASRGDLVCGVAEPATVTDQVEASLVWMSDTPLVTGRRYLVRIGSATSGATVTRLKYLVDIDTGERLAASELALNDIGVVNVAFDAPVALDPYAENRDLGGFILIDRLTNHTIAAGMVHFGLRRGENVHWQHTEVDARARAELNGHRAAVVWLTGLSGSGKSTIANVLERKLHHRGVHTYLLDGDNIRHGLNRDLGFTEADRAENIRRIGEVAELFADAGIVVIAAFISPYRAERQGVRDLVAPGTFCEVHVDTPIDVAESRDPKGLYAKARRGELQNFTGIDAPYEPPVDPEIHVDTSVATPEDAADLIVAHLHAAGVFDRP